MSNPAYTTMAPEIVSVRARLGRLRRQVANWILIDGMSHFLWLALGLAAFDLVVDWSFRMDRPQRAVMLALMLAALGWAAYRWLVRPLSLAASDDALALELESAHPILGQSLISALQLSRVSDLRASGMSPELVREAIASGLQRAQEISFGSVLDRRRFSQNSLFLLLAGLVVGLATIGTLATAPLRTWFNRNILLGSATWPQKTYLVIERVGPAGIVVFPSGDDWTQVVSVRPDSRVVPDVVYLDERRGYVSDQGPRPMKKSGERTFEATFANVTEEFEFRARGGDAVTDWVRVELVAPPELTGLKLVLTPPKYTNQAPEELAPGRGPYSALPGSSLRLEGSSNKELARAALVIEGEPLLTSKAEEVNRPTNRKSSIALNAGSKGKIVHQLTADELMAGQYRFDLEDRLGLTSRQPTTFALRKRIDREPRVRVRLIGISGMVVPQARIPFACRVADDFGITAVTVGYRWKAGDDLPGAGEGFFPLAPSPASRPSLDLSVDDSLEMGPLKIPTGAGLSFRFEATDNDDVNGPNVGRSAEFLVRVVTEEELRTDLLRREKEQRHDLEKLLKDQEDLLTDSRALAAAVKPQADLGAEQKDRLVQNARRQKLVGHGASSVAERLAGIVVEVQNNRLEADGGRLQTRIRTEIVEPIQAVAESLIPQATAALEQARHSAAKPAVREQDLTKAISAQAETAARMKEILEHMVKSEGFQEAVNLLYEIQKAQTDVNNQTNQARQERIKRILEGAVP
jgi:hypothetical protein